MLFLIHAQPSSTVCGHFGNPDISVALITLQLGRRFSFYFLWSHFISYGFVVQVKCSQAVKLCHELGSSERESCIQKPRGSAKTDECILSYCSAFSRMSQSYEVAHKSSLQGNICALTPAFSVIDAG